MSKKLSEKRKASIENLKKYAFKPGSSGNPQGKRRVKPLTLSQAYARQLSTVDPATGRSYAETIARQVVARAVNGDTLSIMVALSQDTEELIKKAVEKLCKETGCTRQAAKLALSLFMPENLI